MAIEYNDGTWHDDDCYCNLGCRQEKQRQPIEPKQNFERIWADHDKRYWEYRNNVNYVPMAEARRMEDERWVMSMLRSYMEKDHGPLCTPK